MAINATYQVYTGGRWLPNVVNLTDYAGIYGSPVQGVYASLSTGSVQYRVHTTGGSWLPWVSDRTDYAGILGRNIDGLQMKVSGLSRFDIKYRAYVGGRWLPWVIGTLDYAGIYGQNITAIQMEIIATSGNTNPGYDHPTSININGYSIVVWVQPGVVRIQNDLSLRNMLKNTSNGSRVLANKMRSRYKAQYGNDINVSETSMGVEILGHVYPGEMAKAVRNLANLVDANGIAKYIEDNILSSTAVVDSGEKAYDGNRWVWDTLAPFYDILSPSVGK